jgi:hypothetical protein
MTRIRTSLSIVSFGLAASLSLPAFAQGGSTESDTAPPNPDFGGESMTLTVPPGPTTGAYARDDGPPLLFGGNVEIGGYGGLTSSYARMFGRDGALVGIEGALLIDHRLSLGAAWYGWANPLTGPDTLNGDSQHFQTGYGGATVHYSFFFDRSPVYLTVGALVGGGAIALERDHDSGVGDVSDGDRNSHDLFAIVQPDVALNANLTHWMRVGVTAGYRFASGANRLGFDNGDLSGFMVGGQLQFGRF